MLSLSLIPTWVRAGADGIEIRWLGRSRFIPFSAADRLAAETRFIEPHVRFKQTMSIPSRVVEHGRGVLVRHDDDQTFLVCDSQTVVRDLVAAVEGRRAKHRAAAAVDLMTIRRGAKDVGEWMASLRGLLADGGYRGRATTEDELWTVLENPRSEPQDRAAAAVALRAQRGDDARPRLRIAIEACASPRLRVALEAIDERDEPAARASLEELTAG
jgi:hypothetical protein